MTRLRLRATAVILAVTGGPLIAACAARAAHQLTSEAVERATIEAIVDLDARNSPSEMVYCVAVAGDSVGIDPDASMEDVSRAVGRRVMSASSCAADRTMPDSAKVVAVHLVKVDTRDAKPSVAVSTIRSGGRIAEFRCSIETVGGEAKAECEASSIS